MTDIVRIGNNGKDSSLIISFKTNVTIMKKIAEGGDTRFLEESPKLINIQ